MFFWCSVYVLTCWNNLVRPRFCPVRSSLLSHTVSDFPLSSLSPLLFSSPGFQCLPTPPPSVVCVSPALPSPARPVAKAVLTVKVQGAGDIVAYCLRKRAKALKPTSDSPSRMSDVGPDTLWNPTRPQQGAGSRALCWEEAHLCFCCGLCSAWMGNISQIVSFSHSTQGLPLLDQVNNNEVKSSIVNNFTIN